MYYNTIFLFFKRFYKLFFSLHKKVGSLHASEDEYIKRRYKYQKKLKGDGSGMNICVTTVVGYTYTNTTDVTQKEAVSNENVCQKQTKKEYKAFIKDLMDNVPYDSSQANNKESWSITEEGWEQMKNDPDYEAWVLGYTIENRSVHFPFQTSVLLIEKFGASIEEHHGDGIPMNTESPKKSQKKEDSWWIKRHKRMKELMKAQQEAARKKAQMQESVANVYDTNIRTFSKSITGGKTWQ